MCGSIALPSSAPNKVPRFHKLNNAIAVVQKAIFCRRGFVCAVIMAVVSSITKWAASKRFTSEPLKCGDNASPYTPLRPASNSAPPSAPPTVPPDAMTDIADICDAPVNVKKLSAHACQTLAPAPTASTPKAKAKTPTAPLRASADVTTGRTSGSRRNFIETYAPMPFSMSSAAAHGSITWSRTCCCSLSH